MIAALALSGYAVAVACCAPALLAPLTRGGASPRLSLAGWLLATASVLGPVVLGLEFLFRTVAADWPSLTQALRRSVAGRACTPVVYRSALDEGGVTALAILGTVVAAAALCRYGRRVHRARRQIRARAEAARIVGRELAGLAAPCPRAVVLDDPRPAAYCVAGRPAAIVVTSGALAVLDAPQLTAVLAHERAHLAGRHHVVLLLTRALAADDAAARTSGRPTVAAARPRRRILGSG